MAVSENDLVVGPLTPASGVTTISLDFDGTGWEASWLEVYKSGSETPLVLNSDYTVSDAGSVSAVVTLSVPANGIDAYSIYLATPLERSSDMQLRGEFKSEPFNIEMDRLWQRLQYHNTLLGRTLQVGRTADAPSPYTPEPETVVGFDELGGTTLYPVNAAVTLNLDPDDVIRRANVAAVLADTAMGYTSGASVQVSAGQYVLTTAEGFSYKVAASTATDHHLTTAGGVKLYATKTLGEWPLAAFWAAQDGASADDDAWAAVISAFKTDPGPIRIEGFSRITSAIFYQTSGDFAGLEIVGSNSETCGIIGDFVGDYLIGLDGSSLSPGDFQQYGGFKNITLKAAATATIKRGIQTVGWWRANHENVTIGVQGDDAQGFTEDGIYIPLRTDIHANPDFYASVVWSLKKVRVYNCGGSGIKGANNTGYAGWHLQDCTFENNGFDGIEVHANNWRVVGGSCSYNGRYGINYSGEAGVTLTNGYFAGVELDGNATANVFAERFNAGTFLNPRSISRVLNGSETAVSQFKISVAQVSSGLRIIYAYCRIESGMTSEVKIFDGGAGASANISNTSIEGARVLDSGSGGYIFATGALTDLRYKNSADQFDGTVEAANPRRLAWQSYTSQGITTTTTVWNFNLSVKQLGWFGSYNTSTGIFTMPYKGAFLMSINANISAPGAGERIRLFAYKNGSTLLRQWYWDWKSGAEPDRMNIAVSEIIELDKGDTLELRVDSLAGAVPLFDTGSLSLVGLA